MYYPLFLHFSSGTEIPTRSALCLHCVFKNLLSHPLSNWRFRAIKGRQWTYFHLHISHWGIKSTQYLYLKRKAGSLPNTFWQAHKPELFISAKRKAWKGLGSNSSAQQTWLPLHCAGMLCLPHVAVGQWVDHWHSPPWQMFHQGIQEFEVEKEDN